jgi:hypothetical protein
MSLALCLRSRMRGRIPRRLLGLAIALFGPVCTPEVEVLTLELREGTCDAEELSEIRMLSIEVHGFDTAGDFCTLQKRCVSEVEVEPGSSAPLEALEAALAAQRQPLVDTRREGAAYIGVLGRRFDDCFVVDTHPMCALADLANAQDGVLPIELECGACVANDWEFCP